MTEIHDFKERLAYSTLPADEAFWCDVYHRAFPTLVEIIDCSADMRCQAVGIDRKIRLANGNVIKIDEKKRDSDYGDIALEYKHTFPGQDIDKPGWIEKDLGIDYIAYAIMETRHCYMFPFAILQRAWFHYAREWFEKGRDKREGFTIARAENRDYVSWSVCVPIETVFYSLMFASLIIAD